MNRIFGALLLAYLITVCLAPTVYADDGIPDNCEYTSGAYYQPNIFARYEPQNQRLVLADWSTGETVRELTSTPEMQQQFGIIGWSTNCRYLTGLIQMGRRDYDMWLWDTTTGERLQSFGYPGTQWMFEEHARVTWSPDSSYAIFRTTDGFYIWNAASNALTLLVHNDSSYYRSPNLDQTYWDYERGQIIFSGWPGVISYDLQSGQERNVFVANQAVEYWQNTFFTLSNDHTKLAAITDQSGAGARNSRGAISVWDLDNFNSLELDLDDWTGFSPAQVAISPDNRYLVVGYDALRVWDLQNLAENVDDRDPIYRHGGPEALITSVRFVSEGVIETISNEGVQLWDLHTGIYVPN